MVHPFHKGSWCRERGVRAAKAEVPRKQEECHCGLLWSWRLVHLQTGGLSTMVKGKGNQSCPQWQCRAPVGVCGCLGPEQASLGSV